MLPCPPIPRGDLARATLAGGSELLRIRGPGPERWHLPLPDLMEFRLAHCDAEFFWNDLFGLA